MAKFGERLASVFFLAAGAYALGRAMKNKTTSEDGVGAIPSTILIDGDFLLAKKIASLLADSEYIDKYEESHAKDGITKQVVYIYPSFKKAEENLRKVLNYLQNDSEFSISSVDLKNPYVKDFYVRSNKGRVHVAALKSAYSRIYDGYSKRKAPEYW